MKDKPYDGFEIDDRPKGDYGNYTISETETGQKFYNINYIYTINTDDDEEDESEKEGIKVK